MNMTRFDLISWFKNTPDTRKFETKKDEEMDLEVIIIRDESYKV